MKTYLENIKTKYFTIVIMFLFFSNCTNTTPLEGETQKPTITQWHLVNVSGGISGVNIDFELGTIIWIFDINPNNYTDLLYVENNNEDDTIEDGLDHGPYPTSTTIAGDKIFLFVDSEEYGEFIYSNDDKLVINQNNRSNGEQGSDGYIYTFERMVVPLE
ncbi:hypothetical protein KFZ70_14625 [Tamlana fucoidanivorans]|uniref:Uncharacterized protein n=1 Tax=Allotamlana fucoidanivorans TaxID=2583814 RepID=A0A5C4SFP3_9FLAO|nr:hypothetical protein [Tamlana fucoidanivorans]TNJ42414.1 hypothetical protein FGF67_14160 [Tamlana fucoidanivorans]